MKKKEIIASVLVLALLAGAGCSDDGYRARVTELKLVRLAPTSGYAGDIVRILGRNFSEEYGGNTVTINGVEARVIEIARDELSIIVPENAPGNYPVRVETPTATVEGLSFKYNVRPEKEYAVTTVAGNGTLGLVDGIGTAASFSAPEGLNYHRDGSIWIVQRGGVGMFAIRRMDQFYHVTTLCTSPLLNYPWGGDFAPSGDYYVANKGNNKVLRVTSDGTCSEYPITGATLNNPMCVAFSAAGEMYVASRNANEILKIDLATGVVQARYEVKMPESMDVDAEGRVIVGTNNAYYLYQIDTDGSVSTIAGNGMVPSGSSYSDGEENLSTATICMVGGVFCASDGCIYFTDRTAFTVRKLTPAADGSYAAGKLETLAGVAGTKGVTDGTNTTATFSYPAGIVVSNDCSDIYVADGSGSQRIRRLRLR